MKPEQIITSILDTDKYKLTMGQAVYHQYPDVGAGYEFINRGGTSFNPGFGHRLRDQVEQMATIRLQPDERRFLEEDSPELTPDYLDKLGEFRFNPDEVKIDQTDGDLQIKIDGQWQDDIYWEVPLMATISEQHFREQGIAPDVNALTRARQKAETYHQLGARNIDFGTRRRFSKAVHRQVVATFKEHGGSEFLGTSNLNLARENGLKSFGTYAHEWVMGNAGLHGVDNANAQAMDRWAREFDGRLNCALTDTYTTEKFLEDFTPARAEIFTSLRQDSNSPETWTDQVTTHIRQNLELDPHKFTGLYSDSLNPRRVAQIQTYAQTEVKPLFGIGTNNTNDVGVKPLNMVIKMFYVTRPQAPDVRVGVAKISDDPGKSSGDLSVINSFNTRR